MLPTTGVEQALQTLLSQVEPTSPKEFSLEEARGLVLAERVCAAEQHPAHDTSAMDGYAVHTAGLETLSHEGSVELEVIEDVKAGFPPQKEVKSGQASRISTGGLVPSGADAVVMREIVELLESPLIRLTEPVRAGQNIRYAGEHLQVGDEVLQAGQRLGSPEVGMAAFLGRERLLCHPPVTVAVLATGSELVAGGQALGKGQIRDSNSVALAAAVQTLGGEVTMKTRVADNPEALDQALKEAFACANVVITSGGISAGWHDLVRQRIEELGGVFSFHKLRMRPGKPLAFGHANGGHFFCLPGNPVSSLVTFEIFVKPALLKMMGREHQPSIQRVVLAEPIRKKRGFTIFFRGKLSSDGVRLTGPQGSHILRSLVDADVLIRTPEDLDFLDVGTEVEVYPFG